MRDPNATAGPDFAGVIVAAGRSERFGSGTAKQFRDLDGQSVLERAVRVVAERPAVGRVVVVLAAQELDGPRAAAVRRWPGVSDVVRGGETRAESVAGGLSAAGAAPFVLIHDAARPLASVGLVEAVMDAARRHGAAVPLLSVVDTIKETDREGWVTRTLDRTRLGRAQTPQGFRRSWLRAALERARREGIGLTDEAAALEHDGRRVWAVPGERQNVKITSPEDLDETRRLLVGGPELRVGSGFDIHRFGGGGPLVLGGVVFEGEPGLAGHSDADVVLHAAMDALLGAAALGDIGSHFPPSEERFRGVSSAELAARVAERIRQAGFEIVNLDLTLLAELPRISKRSDAMCEAISRSLGIERRRVSLKATTLERLGALGRGEGIACQAACLLTWREPPGS